MIVASCSRQQGKELATLPHNVDGPGDKCPLYQALPNIWIVYGTYLYLVPFSFIWRIIVLVHLILQTAYPFLYSLFTVWLASILLSPTYHSESARVTRDIYCSWTHLRDSRRCTDFEFLSRTRQSVLGGILLVTKSIGKIKFLYLKWMGRNHL